MMDYRKFEKDPAVLVGKGKTAFVSTRSDGVTPAKRSKNQDNHQGASASTMDPSDDPTELIKKLLEKQ